jgi:hypothetical protein
MRSMMAPIAIKMIKRISIPSGFCISFQIKEFVISLLSQRFA